jgi:hypothetical protein
MTNIGIILGSTRPGRVGHQVAEWVAEQGGQHDGIDVEVVDIEDYGLPVFDEPQSPLLGSYAHAHTQEWSKRIAEFDGYVFVTPQYNRSIPAALKNAIDYLYGEWNNKAAGFVSYGSNVCCTAPYPDRAGVPRRRDHPPSWGDPGSTPGPGQTRGEHGHRRPADTLGRGRDDDHSRCVAHDEEDRPADHRAAERPTTC